MYELKAIVVDDESLARKGLSMRLAQFEAIKVVGECSNGREALSTVTELQPDLMFLDIQMPGMSGFDVISKLQQETMPLIIFVTAFDQYAIDAFQVHAVDYLLKPIDDDRLLAAVNRAREHATHKDTITEKQRLLELIISITGKSETSIAQLLNDHPGSQSLPNRLAVKDGDETTLVKVSDIDWVDAAGDYMCIHARGETHIMRITMKELEQQLDPSIFQRVHRSTIVNLDRIVKVCRHINGEYFLTLANGNSVKMSRSYKDKVKHFF